VIHLLRWYEFVSKENLTFRCLINPSLKFEVRFPGYYFAICRLLRITKHCVSVCRLMTSEANVDDAHTYKSFYLRNYAAREGHIVVTSILDYFIFLEGVTGLKEITMSRACLCSTSSLELLDWFSRNLIRIFYRWKPSESRKL
jgi:hypothetical protein